MYFQRISRGLDAFAENLKKIDAFQWISREFNAFAMNSKEILCIYDES